jgi:hypothetical protein
MIEKADGLTKVMVQNSFSMVAPTYSKVSDTFGVPGRPS